MKRIFSNKENREITGFEVLNSNEMLKVRGGAMDGTRPVTRSKDLLDPDD